MYGGKDKHVLLLFVCSQWKQHSRQRCVGIILWYTSFFHLVFNSNHILLFAVLYILQHWWIVIQEFIYSWAQTFPLLFFLSICDRRWMWSFDLSSCVMCRLVHMAAPDTHTHTNSCSLQMTEQLLLRASAHEIKVSSHSWVLLLLDMIY